MAGAGQGGDLVRLLELIGDDCTHGPDEAATDGVVGAEAGPGLGDEDDGDVEAPGPFDHVDGGAGAVGQLRELVDDQGLAPRVLSGDGPVQHVFEEEGADFGGFVAVLGSADGDVGGPAVFVGPGAVEAGADGPGNAAARASGPDKLSRHERDVALLAAQGLRAKDIAARLVIGRRTVDYHLANIYAKLGVASKLDLAARADQFGLRPR